MSPLRLALLCFGPLGLVAAAWSAAGIDLRGASATPERFHVHAPQRLPAAPPQLTSESSDLEQACRETADRLASQLGGQVAIVLRPPFVVAGDFSIEELSRLAENVVEPIGEALHASYFDRRPDAPISIVALSSEPRYHQAALDLDNRRTARYYGYFVKAERRIVLNIATGHGTLAHELTHALAAFDAPQLPVWFEEGLAALHEQCEFSVDGSQLLGQPNWRGACLLERLEKPSFPTVAEFVAQNRMPVEDAAFDYAYARHVCLYLQAKGVLRKFYRLMRDRSANDERGLHALRSLIAPATLADLDADFRRWLHRELADAG